MKHRGALAVVGSLLVGGLGWAYASQPAGLAEPMKEIWRAEAEADEPSVLSTGISQLEPVAVEETLRLAAADPDGAAHSSSLR